jgi:hypothetical protein
MAEEVPKITTQEVVPPAEEQNKTDSTIPDDKESDEPKPILEPEKKPAENNTLETVTETDLSKPGEDEKVPESGSFKEESTIVGELPGAEKKALQELKQLIQEALNKHEFSAVSTPKQEKSEPEPEPESKPTTEAETQPPPVDDNKKEEQNEQVSETESVVAVTTADDDVSPPPVTEPEQAKEKEKKGEKRGGGGGGGGKRCGGWDENQSNSSAHQIQPFYYISAPIHSKTLCQIFLKKKRKTSGQKQGN